MNICEFIQEKVAIGEFDDNVSAHLRICPECKAFADDLDRLLTCALPDAGEPPKRIDDAIRAAAAETAAANRLLSMELPDVEPPKHVDDFIRAAALAAAANVRRKRVAKAFRILVPVAAALAVCFLFFFEPTVGKPQQLAVPTQATVAADWTGAVMDGELTQVTMELTNSMTNLSLSDTDLLIAQLEADFAAYAEN